MFHDFDDSQPLFERRRGQMMLVLARGVERLEAGKGGGAQVVQRCAESARVCERGREPRVQRRRGWGGRSGGAAERQTHAGCGWWREVRGCRRFSSRGRERNAT